MTSAQPSNAAASRPPGRTAAIFQSGVAVVLLGPSYVIFLGSIPGLVLAVHAVTGLVMLAAGFWLKFRRHDASPVFHAAAWFIVAGPFGSLIALAGSVLGGSSSNSGINFREYVDQQMEAPPIAQALDMACAIRDNRVRLSGATDIAAFRDTLSGTDQRAKLKTLSVMSREYRPEFAAALQLALRDSDAAVRVLGAGVLSRLQEQFSARIEALEARVKLDPSSPAAHRALAAEHNAYAFSGLLSPERQMLEVERAAQHLRACGDIPEPGGSLHAVPTAAAIHQSAVRGDATAARSPGSRLFKSTPAGGAR